MSFRMDEDAPTRAARGYGNIPENRGVVNAIGDIPKTKPPRTFGVILV